MGLTKTKERQVRRIFELLNPDNLFAVGEAKKHAMTHLIGAEVKRFDPVSKTVVIDEDVLALWSALVEDRRKILEKERKAYARIKLERSQLAARRVLDGKPVDHAAHYRMMALAEWREIASDWVKSGDSDPEMIARYAKDADHKFRFRATFDYHNTKFYRLWFSTSLQKCRSFENARATAPDRALIRFWFAPTPRAAFSANQMKPHQMKGVQHEANIVAYHREEFAEQDTSAHTMAGMRERLNANPAGGDEAKRHYNLGFTSVFCDWLEEHCVAAERMRM